MSRLITARQKDSKLLSDIKGVTDSDHHFYAWWLGQSGFLIRYQGAFLLFDPYLSDSLTRKYADTDKPHVRMSEQVVDPGQLDFIDVITTSHNHTDHLDADTLNPILQANPNITFVGPEANRAFIANRLGRPESILTGMNDMHQVEAGPFRILGVPAAHNELERDEQGRCRFMGYVVQFGPFTVYHSGDTLWHDELLSQLRPFSIDLAFLPINGNKPERRVAGNLNYKEAVAMGKHLNIKTVVPCHYDMFTFNTEDVSLFETEAKAANQGFRVLLGGEKMKVASA